jgi:tetratricopeptide (TPR) repeat protein
MKTMVWAAIAAALAAGLMSGCSNPRVTDVHLTDSELARIQQGILMPDSREVDYVEQLAAARQGYKQSLLDLIAYYESVGNATKLQWARTELKTFEQVVRYSYLMPGEWMPESLSASESIPEADRLYEQAMSLYRQSGGLILVTNEAVLRQALQLFNQLITEYPSSDKIDDAAYRAARIYEYLKNYELAAVLYQRTFQWNPETRYPARFRAAYVLDRRLKMRADALALYKLAVERESMYQNNVEYAMERIQQLSTPSPAPAPELQIQGD